MASPSRGVWGHAPQKILKFGVLEMPFSAFFRGTFLINKYVVKGNSIVYFIYVSANWIGVFGKATV